MNGLSTVCARLAWRDERPTTNRALDHATAFGPGIWWTVTPKSSPVVKSPFELPAAAPPRSRFGLHARWSTSHWARRQVMADSPPILAGPPSCRDLAKVPRPDRERCAECRLRKFRRPDIHSKGSSGRSSAEDAGHRHRRGVFRPISGRPHTWRARFVRSRQDSPAEEPMRMRSGSCAGRSRAPVVAPCSSCAQPPLAARGQAGLHRSERTEQTALPG